ncbi:glycosyl transferase [Betaproteobacteria bacterium]|nr:glycosyl transferase [Betaproteobacteria bacterium]GHU25347.1 glycosyl transferase [Betaproteobacteria bacterium]
MSLGAHSVYPGRKTLRVLQFCHGYYGPFLDCARQYASLFVDTPYQVTTVYLTGEADEAVVRGSASDEVIFLDYQSADVRGLKLRAIRDLRRICRERDFSFCIAHRFKPIYVALMGTALPVIGVHHAFGDYHRLSHRLFVHAFRRRLALLGVSNALRDDLRGPLSSWPKERIETLYNRIDIKTVQAEQVSRVEARAALGLPQDVWVVGNAGRLHPDKDQATLIRGFAQALPHLPPGSLLVIMGQGRLESALKALVGELGVGESVRFLGQIPNARSTFKAFDVFALTSDHEPFGMVLLEAMAAGLPLICSDCGGGREVVEGIGALFPLGDAKALARCLVRVAEQGVPDDYPKRVTEHLQKFSDEAAAEIFWRFPMLQAILAGERQ